MGKLIDYLDCKNNRDRKKVEAELRWSAYCDEMEIYYPIRWCDNILIAENYNAAMSHSNL